VNLKVAFMLLLVFAFCITATAIAFNMPTSISLPAIGGIGSSSNSLIKPLGDPVPGPGFPH